MEGNINLKIIMIGDANVGKTSIIRTYLEKEFPIQYLPTIGNITTKKEYNIKEKIINITVWDAGGQKAFNPFNRALYSNIDGALLVFDITNPTKTFIDLKKEFLENVNRYSEEVITLFIGNKLDLLTNHQQLVDTLKELMTKRDHIYMISAKTGEGVNECFELLIYTILRKAELLNPDLVPSNTSTLFLKLIGKSEEQLKSKLLTLSNIDSGLQKVKIKPKVEKESDEEKKAKESKYYDFLWQELEKNNFQRIEVMDQFLINISELDKAIKNLQKLRTKSSRDLIESLKNLLITTSKDFEVSLDLILKLNREEFELVKIITKVKEEQSIYQEL